MKKRYLILFTACFFLHLSVFAEDIDAKDDTSTVLKVDFPLFDFPYQIDIMRARDFGFSTHIPA